MKLALLSDIHGNLPSLEIAIKELKKKKIYAYFFLGDSVNYGPWSNECVEFIENLENSYKILGNHEDYFIKKKCDSINDLANTFFDFCIKDFTKVNIIKKYKKRINFEKINFVHTIEDKYIFPETDISINAHSVCGHSHFQFKKKIKDYWLINPGSVGQNRKSINTLQFGILDTKTLKVEFFSKIYDVKILVQKMISKKYPKKCIDYYVNKIT